MIELCVWQRGAQASASAWTGPVFRTCRREIAFADGNATPPPGIECFTGEDAYAHLLQVSCGLDSPMLGETEVMHQFRVFIDALPADQYALQSLGRRLLADARVVRAQHLTGLGSRSYGSAVRRHIRDCERVAVIGTGMLASEVLPFVSDDGRVVDVYGRRDAFEAPPSVFNYRRLDRLGAEPLEGRTALVVAAPVPSSMIGQVGATYRSLAAVIDLRGEAAGDPAPPIAPIVSLDDVFREMQQAAEITDRRVAAAKIDIARHARAFATRAILNPSGWHDLCA